MLQPLPSWGPQRPLVLNPRDRIKEPWRRAKSTSPHAKTHTPDAVPDAALAELPEAITSSSIRSKRTRYDTGHWPALVCWAGPLTAGSPSALTLTLPTTGGALSMDSWLSMTAPIRGDQTLEEDE